MPEELAVSSGGAGARRHLEHAGRPPVAGLWPAIVTAVVWRGRPNYPPGAWNPGPLQWQFMEAIDGLMQALLVLFQAIQKIRAEPRRRLGRPTLKAAP